MYSNYELKAQDFMPLKLSGLKVWITYLLCYTITVNVIEKSSRMTCKSFKAVYVMTMVVSA